VSVVVATGRSNGANALRRNSPPRRRPKRKPSPLPRSRKRPSSISERGRRTCRLSFRCAQKIAQEEPPSVSPCTHIPLGPAPARRLRGKSQVPPPAPVPEDNDSFYMARYWWIKAMAMLPPPTPLDTCLMELWRTFSGSSLPEARQADSSGKQDRVLTSEARPHIPIGPLSSPLLRPMHHPEAHGP
jgi:hypothetical protein